MKKMARCSEDGATGQVGRGPMEHFGFGNAMRTSMFVIVVNCLNYGLDEVGW